MAKKQFKVFLERKESLYTIVEAETAEEAERLVDNDEIDYDLNECDGTMETFVTEGDTEEY